MDEIILNDFIITRYYSLYFPDEKMAVFSDFHIGFEEVMAQKGLLLPKLQKRRIIEILDKMFQFYDIEMFLIDGDFKHEFSRNVKQEWNEVEEIINYILKRSELVVVRGNHDNYLQTILSKYGITLMRSFKVRNYTFVHGDKPVEVKNKIIIGHEHPSIKIRDNVGGILSMPTFLQGKCITVLPSPSIYSSGSDILAGDILSPILKNYNIDEFRVYSLDDKLGIMDLGKIRELKNLYKGI
ncbi:MAG: metallophosphoesterase [Thermoplasmata archaeon]